MYVPTYMHIKGAVQCLQEKPYKVSLLQLLYSHISQWFVVVIILCNTIYVASKHRTVPLILINIL